MTTNVLLMEQTQSTKIVYAEEMTPVVNALSQLVSGTKIVAIETLSDLLEVDVPLFPFRPRLEEALGQPIVILHSSGSTGLPKPVIMTHGTFTVMDNDRNFPQVAGRKNHDLTIWDFDGTPGRIYEPFPPFHLAGFMSKVMVPLYTNAIPVFGPPLRPSTGALVAEIMQHQRIRGCLLPPSVAEQLLHEPNGLRIFQQLDIFCYAGGPLSPATGDKISEVTMVCQFYGSTEVGQVRQLVPKREEWSYMEFHPNAKIELQQSIDDAYELVVFADATTADSVALNYNYPGVKEWRTKDLFKPHPTKKNLWRFHGRKDDILVLSNGAKLNPTPMESELQGLPNISGALVIGQNRFQPALIVEMNADCHAHGDGFIEEIWPVVESANVKMPGYGRIARSMILLAQPDKPLVRAGKGTVVRKLSENAYTKEIEDLYAGQNPQVPMKPSPLVATAFSSEAVDNLIRSILPSALNAEKLGYCDDLYNFGLDSLKTIEAAESLRSSLLPHRQLHTLAWLSAETFYSNPTIKQLSQIVLAFLNQGVIPQKQDRFTRMIQTLEKFTRSLERSKTSLPPKRKLEKLSIVLTGTTGNLGKHLLEHFSSDPIVSRIYCFNRSSTAEQQWAHWREMNRCNPTTELIFITIDFSLKNFGLDDNAFSRLLEDCDLILHVAWKVDFNLDLSSFEENIQSVQTLANWSILSPNRPRIIFLSSISSVGPWNLDYDNDLGIPEAPIGDLEAALRLGYSESKQIAENLLNTAFAQSHVPASILRVGQIGGSLASCQTQWTQREVFPAMLKTSKSIGLIPLDLPAVDWIPVDIVSKIVAELALNDMKDPPPTIKYYNVVNPNPTPWREFIPCFQRYCGSGAQIVTISQWVDKLRAFNVTDVEELSSKPALNLLKFFSLLANYGPTTRYQTSGSVQTSKTMGRLASVTQSLMEKWIEQIA